MQVEGGHLRVVVRRPHANADPPLLLYQPFAGSWPQLHAGDAYFWPLLGPFALATFDPRGIGESTSVFDASPATQASDLVNIAATLRAHYGVEVHVVAISTAACSTVSALRARRDLFASATFVAPLLNPQRTAPDLAEEVARVWSLPPALTSYIPAFLYHVLVLHRSPYSDCHDNLWCMGDFYFPHTYSGSPHYPRPLSTWWRALRAMYGMTLDYACDDLVVDARIPTLVLVGERDLGITPVWHVREWHARMPTARLAIVPNASHALHIEQNHRFVSEVCALAGRAPCPLGESPNSPVVWATAREVMVAASAAVTLSLHVWRMRH